MTGRPGWVLASPGPYRLWDLYSLVDLLTVVSAACRNLHLVCGTGVSLFSKGCQYGPNQPSRAKTQANSSLTEAAMCGAIRRVL
jgi:hypothetical protein